MSVGVRVHKLRLSRGDSLVQAEQRTGVSRETIRRIEKGETPASLLYHLQRIAGGYGVPLEVLVEGKNPAGDLEWFIAESSGIERLQMSLCTLQERLHLALQFCAERYPSLAEPTALAAVSGLTPEQVAQIRRGWHGGAPDRHTALAMAKGLSQLSGIDLGWLLTGFLTGEAGLSGSLSGISGLISKGVRSVRAPGRVPVLCSAVRQAVV